MKLLSTYASGLLGIIMIAAILLPSLHALEHDAYAQSNNEAHLDVKIAKVAFDCDLCDFHFSSHDTPDFEEYELYLPFRENVHSVSISQTIFLYYKNSFSLRAPPAVIA